MIAVGVDTHKQRHCAVAVDALGQVLGEVEFAATATGYAQLRQWAERHDDPGELVFGIEEPAAGAPASAKRSNAPVTTLSRLKVRGGRSAAWARQTASTRLPPASAYLLARRSRPHADAGLSRRCGRC
jgi:hypothetical protein